MFVLSCALIISFVIVILLLPLPCLIQLYAVGNVRSELSTVYTCKTILKFCDVNIVQ